MKKYTIQLPNFMSKKEITIIAKDKQTAIQIAKAIVSKHK